MRPRPAPCTLAVGGWLAGCQARRAPGQAVCLAVAPAPQAGRGPRRSPRHADAGRVRIGSGPTTLTQSSGMIPCSVRGRQPRRPDSVQRGPCGTRAPEHRRSGERSARRSRPGRAAQHARARVASNIPSSRSALPMQLPARRPGSLEPRLAADCRVPRAARTRTWPCCGRQSIDVREAASIRSRDVSCVSGCPESSAPRHGQTSRSPQAP